MDTGTMNTFIKIAEFKYPHSNNDILFLFDQSSGYCTFSNNALIAYKMNLSAGGKQSLLQDAMWDSNPQNMGIKWFRKKVLK